MSQPTFPNGIWAVDFEFHPAHGQEGSLPVPVCMVAQELQSGRTLRCWQDELAALSQAPFPTDSGALFVAYYASAEIGCFQQLGWTLPTHTLDLFTEFRWLTNGRQLLHGKGLVGALLHFGLPAITADEKDAWRDLVLRRGPWTDAERIGILDYCETDVVALANLFPKMQPLLDWSRALLRGRYMQALAGMETNGLPIDTDMLDKLVQHWPSIQHQFIADTDAEFQVYDGHTFKAARFAEYLAAQDIPWPRLKPRGSVPGALALDDDTFKDMAAVYPRLAPLRELRSTLSTMRSLKLPIGVDGRNRCMLSAFGSTTGRNQPSTTRFVFGLSSWLRGLIRPQPGFGLAYIRSGGTPDRSNAEFWGGTIPWVKTGQIDFNVIQSAEEFITPAGLENSAARMFPAGTILMAMYGQGVTRGRVAILGIDATTNQACAAIEVTSAEIDRDFLYWSLAGKYEELRAMSESRGGNQSNLNAQLIREVKLSLPDLPTQRTIVAEIEAEQDLVASNRELIHRMEAKVKAAIDRVWGEAS